MYVRRDSSILNEISGQLTEDYNAKRTQGHK